MLQNKSKSVSECLNCGAKKKKYCMCNTPTNPSKEPADHIGDLNEKTDSKPTVEKWEHAVVELLKSYIWTSAGHPVNLDGVNYSKMIKLFRTTIAHSVQEAKAERDREIVEIIKNEPEPVADKQTSKDFVSGYKWAKHDLLASLKQEEEKVNLYP